MFPNRLLPSEGKGTVKGSCPLAIRKFLYFCCQGVLWVNCHLASRKGLDSVEEVFRNEYAKETFPDSPSKCTDQMSMSMSSSSSTSSPFECLKASRAAAYEAKKIFKETEILLLLAEANNL